VSGRRSFWLQRERKRRRRGEIEEQVQRFIPFAPFPLRRSQGGSRAPSQTTTERRGAPSLKGQRESREEDREERGEQRGGGQREEREERERRTERRERRTERRERSREEEEERRTSSSSKRSPKEPGGRERTTMWVR